MKSTWVAVLLLLLCITQGLVIGNQKTVFPHVVAGQVHYSRIPVEYWQHRLLTIKSMGFNTLSVYIMWNYHQVSRGVFDYSTDNKNITLFLELAKKHDFYVLIRPGPYVCAEWDFGGFPTRLMNIPNLKIRSNDPVYLGEVKVYVKSLAPILAPFLANKGGPIILLQIENQYGSYGSDIDYIQALRQQWKEVGIEVDQYHADAGQGIAKSHWPGANIGVNDGITQDQYTHAKSLEPDAFIFGGQIYSGWLTHWGQKFQGKNISQYTKEFEFLFKGNHSFSMYMVHGGSNFGLTAGANQNLNGVNNYQPHITSYDYDAPINEQGSPNAKFTAFRNLAEKYVAWKIPEPPAPLPVIQIPPFKPFKIASLYGNLPDPISAKFQKLPPFESDELNMFNQGMVVYESNLFVANTQVTIIAHDFAMAFMDGKLIGTFSRHESQEHTFKAFCNIWSSPCRFTVLVEAMGHVNFDHYMDHDYKGLISMNPSPQWNNIYRINIDNDILKWRNISGQSFPSLAKANFNLTQTGDTFINVKNYQKGYVWVNGHNLGRYWNIGPSQKLFCPGVWLRKGQNDLHILDLMTDEISEISGEKTLK